MPRLLHYAFILLALLCGISDPSLAGPRRNRPATTIQASISNNGLAIVSSPGGARVLSAPKGMRKLNVRRNERLVAVEETKDGLVAAGIRDRGSESRLVFLESGPSGRRRLPAPAGPDALRRRPILLMDDGELVATAWLEGPDSRGLRVKVADWDGSRWGPVTTVSRPSEGSQTGLTGTVLRDGSTLLMWSQFDGTDDEILFSWRQSVNWSYPERVSVDNRNPDVAPSVSFTRKGALAAWSRFDGSTYRLWTARFDSGLWRQEQLVGESGSLFPQLLQRQDGLYLLYRSSSSPRGWSIRRTTGNARGEYASFVAAETSSPPVLSVSSEASITLAWPQDQRRVKTRLELLP